MPHGEGTIRSEETGHEHVRLVRIHRPEKRNALDQATREALVDALEEGVKAGARALVLTGTEKSFASGADLAEMRERSVSEQRDYLHPPRLYEQIEALPAPVIAAINGFALGAGLELALACDVRIAARSAKLGAPEVRLGLIPGGGGTQRLPRLVGMGEAMRMVLTGEILEAQQARERGLVQAIVDRDELEQEALELAGRMARWSPIALANAKKALQQAWRRPLQEGLSREVDAFCDAFASRDAKEGIDAFLEGREPTFDGR